MSYSRDGFMIIDRPILAKADFEALSVRVRGRRALADAAPHRLASPPHFTDPALLRCLLSDRIVDLLEPVLGPDIALFTTRYFSKPAGYPYHVPWHRDASVFSASLTPAEVCTLWLAIDPSTEANGCLRVLSLRDSGFAPRSARLSRSIRVPSSVEKRAVSLETSPNHGFLMGAWTLHSSGPNPSSDRRCALAARYVSTRVKFDKSVWGDWFHLYLARGRDRGGNRYGDPGRRYPETARQYPKRLRSIALD
jgi:hypothetical protein